MNHNPLVLLIFCAILLPNLSQAKTLKVALFIPQQSPFWNLVSNFSQEAANDLKVELKIYDAQSNQFQMIDQVQDAISGPNKVDAIIFQNFKHVAQDVIKMAEKAQVYCYLFNSSIPEDDNLGKPRQRYKYWVGEMLPDDIKAASDITHQLIDTALAKKRIASDGKVHVVAIAGRLADTSSIDRIKGVEHAIKERTDSVLKQVFHTDWGEEEGIYKYYGARARYPSVSVIFSASYRTTNGIVDFLMPANKEVYTNSFGLTEDSLEQVARGEIVTTTGGHYIEGAWALVQMYDYLHGIDFANEAISRGTPMPIINKANVDFFISRITDKKFTKENLSKIDFTQYSKKLNPKLKKYSFDFESILSQL